MCYGGKAMKKGGEVEKDDMAQDKKLIKKAFKQHDEAEHDKEPTEIKLRKGGRAKKAIGTVNKYKTGGSVENVYGAKKASGDLDRIEKTKDIKPGSAAAPSKAATKPAMEGSDVAKEKSKPAGSTKAVEVKKYANGSMVGTDRKLAELEAMQRQARRKNAMGLGAAQQNELIKQSPSAAGLAPTMSPSMPAPAPSPMAPPQPASPTGMPAQKRGGKVKKGC
jgi:hypothetical protein